MLKCDEKNRLTVHWCGRKKLRRTVQPFNNNYPKVEYPGPDFLKDTSIIRNLIFAIQQVTIMQVYLNPIPC